MKKTNIIRLAVTLCTLVVGFFVCYAMLSPQKTKAQTPKKEIPAKTFTQADFIPAPKDDKSDKTLSPYFVVLSQHPNTDYLPLKETSASVNIVGVIADVAVKQKYVNSGKDVLEAIYTFPMSSRAAVYGMTMKIGKRTIIAKIEEKEKARTNYEKAKSEGKRASLLEQSRPNVFTMNVANIDVGDTIEVELKYTELLIPESGIYSFVYPTVVGPRYSNKPAKDAPTKDKFVNTPYTKDGVKPTYNFAFDMRINSTIPVQEISSSTHKLNMKVVNPNQTQVNIDPSESKGGNRDVVINYSLKGNKINSGLMTYEGKDENFFLLMVQPPKTVQPKEIPPREYIFIVDVSGSMEGFPLTISKKLIKDLLSNLRPKDKFNVVLFAGAGNLMSPQSMNANPENIQKAITFVDSQEGGGGTELMTALKTAYAIPRTENNLSRTFVIATDGYVDIEHETFDFIRNHGGKTNFFTFGIGSSVNRYLLEGMAFMGKGEPAIILNEHEAIEKARKFRQQIKTPILTNIQVNYGALQVYDVEPMAVPDMLAERPIIIFGKYKGKAQGTITVSGKTGNGVYSQTFDLASAKPSNSNSAIRYLWARERIKMLDYYTATDDGNKKLAANKKEITELGLKYNLMTEYTSFIAIDNEKTVKNGNSTTINQPVPLPENVSESSISGVKNTICFVPPPVSTSCDMKACEDVKEYLPVEQMPQFPGGEEAMKKYIQDNIQVVAKDGKQLSGRVVIRFIVAEDGSITEATVIKSLDPLYDNEALRVVRSMPKWIPGRQNGKNVPIYYTLPIIFQ